MLGRKTVSAFKHNEFLLIFEIFIKEDLKTFNLISFNADILRWKLRVNESLSYLIRAPIRDTPDKINKKENY